MKTKMLPRRRRPRDVAPPRPDSFFLIDLAAAAPKDILPHLEHPFFGLSKIPYRKNDAVRRYESPSGKEYLQLTGSPKYGLPTIFDQDLLIYAVSVLAAERARLEDAPFAPGQKRVLDNVIQFSAAEFADFSRRTDPRTGRLPGSRYEEIEAAIYRLTTTTIITNIAAAGYRRTKLFGMLDSATIDRREKLSRFGDSVDPLVACRIELSDWIMAAIEGGHLISLHPRYFDLRRPLDRRLYAIIRKHCGRQGKWEIGLDKLRLKSGATTALPRFRRQIRDFAARWERRMAEEDENFLGYVPSYDPARDMLTVRHPPKASSVRITGTSLSLPAEPDGNMTAIIRAEMPGYDPYPIYQDWLQFTLSSDEEIRSPPAALRGYCRKRQQRSPKLR